MAAGVLFSAASVEGSGLDPGLVELCGGVVVEVLLELLVDGPNSLLFLPLLSLLISLPEFIRLYNLQRLRTNINNLYASLREKIILKLLKYHSLPEK